MQLKMYGGIAVVAVIGAAVSQVDKSMNYIETPAIVTSASVDCFVKDSNSEVVEKATGKLAYMDCLMAPIAAEMHGHSARDVKQRVKFEYEYTSPVDGSRQSGERTMTNNVERYDAEGKTFMIYAHKSDVAKRRF